MIARAITACAISPAGPCTIAQETLSQTPAKKFVAPAPGWWRGMVTNRLRYMPRPNWMTQQAHEQHRVQCPELQRRLLQAHQHPEVPGGAVVPDVFCVMA